VYKLFAPILAILILFNFNSIGQNTTASEQFTDWNNDSGWSNGSAPGNDVVGGDLVIDGSVVRLGSLSISRTFFSGPMTLTIKSGDSLVIDDDFTIGLEAELVVEEGGYLYVNGDLNNQGIFIFAGDVSNDGIIGVNGDYNQGPGASFDKGDNANFYVNGDSDIPGDTDGNIPSEIQDIYNALPIELKSFDGALAKNSVQLDWVTAKEENFSHFEIERSINEKSFEVIGHVEGQGNSMTDVFYDFTDRSIPFGIIRYRLKAVDIDGSFEYFEAIEIKNTFSNQVSAYPNPTTNISNIKIVLPKEFKGKLNKVSLFNSSGRNLYNQLDYDPQVSKLELGELEEGMYILKIHHNGLTENLRVFVH
jgi:hypothetical protein